MNKENLPDLEHVETPKVPKSRRKFSIPPSFAPVNKFEVIIIDNTTVCVEKRIAEEITRLREAVRMCKRFLKDLPQTDP